MLQNVKTRRLRNKKERYENEIKKLITEKVTMPTISPLGDVLKLKTWVHNGYSYTSQV